VKLFHQFPRNCEFYAPTIKAIGKLSKPCLDVAIQIILGLLPDIGRPEVCAIAESQKMKGILDLNFSAFSQNIPNYDSRIEKFPEILVCVIQQLFLEKNIEK
jgi:hypothetical protein